METLTIVSRMPYKVRVQSSSVVDSAWDWCCNTLGTKQWGMMIGFLGESATYCFANAEDATAFKLRFDL